MTALKATNIKGKRLTAAHKENIRLGMYHHWDSHRKGSVGKNGYKHVTKRGIRSYEHREVWADRNGPIPPGLHVHHINGIKTDNRLENLMLLEGTEHSRRHAIENGLGSFKRDVAHRLLMAETIKSRTTSDKGILSLLQLGMTQKQVAETVGLTQPAISMRLKKMRQPISLPTLQSWQAKL